LGRGKGSSNETKIEIYRRTSVEDHYRIGDRQLTWSLSSFQRRVPALMENGDGDRECKEGSRDEEEAMSKQHS